MAYGARGALERLRPTTVSGAYGRGWSGNRRQRGASGASVRGSPPVIPNSDLQWPPIMRSLPGTAPAIHSRRAHARGHSALLAPPGGVGGSVRGGGAGSTIGSLNSLRPGLQQASLGSVAASSTSFGSQITSLPVGSRAYRRPFESYQICFASEVRT